MKKTLTRSARIKRPSSNALHDITTTILVFLAADTVRLHRFLSLTGLEIDTLRSASVADGFAESLLDYLCSDEALLLAYAGEMQVNPAEIAAMRLSLAPASSDG